MGPVGDFLECWMSLLMSLHLVGSVLILGAVSPLDCITRLTVIPGTRGRGPLVFASKKALF